jgi:phosphatidylglycerophosphatase A
MTRLIATFFYIGTLRPAPGTWGSAAAVLAAYVLHGLGSFGLLAVATVVVFFVGWWATIEETRGKEDHDPSEIVIDEVAGQWLALWPLSASLWWMGSDPWAFPLPGWIAAFVLFRIFDIWKPSLVGWFDRRHSALGVMMDDVVAGIMAALVVVLAAAMANKMFQLWEYALWIT